MTDEKDVRRKFQAALQPGSAPVAHLRAASKLALPQPAIMAVWQQMSVECRHLYLPQRRCTHPGNTQIGDVNSCQFAHCPLMRRVLHAK